MLRAMRVTGNIFILIGATFLFFVLYEFVGTTQITKGHQAALAAEFERPAPEPTKAAKPEPNPSFGDAVARIRIPSIDVNMIVVEGATLTELARGPGHYRGTPLPGEAGTVAIAGHRTGWGSPFINLDRLDVGDEIILELKDGSRFVYQVTGTRTVDPGAIWVLDGDPSSKTAFKLTLTTCTPKYTSRDRLIVWADQVDPDPVEPARAVPSKKSKAA